MSIERLQVTTLRSALQRRIATSACAGQRTPRLSRLAGSRVRRPSRPAHLCISDVAEVGRLLAGAMDKALVLYCNGPFSPKTKRLGAELAGSGVHERPAQPAGSSWLASARVQRLQPSTAAYIAVTDSADRWRAAAVGSAEARINAERPRRQDLGRERSDRPGRMDDLTDASSGSSVGSRARRRVAVLSRGEPVLWPALPRCP